MPKQCDLHMLKLLAKTARAGMLGAYWTKDGMISPRSELTLSTGVLGDTSKSRIYKIYAIGECGGLFYFDYRTLRIYVTQVEDTFLYDTRAEAYMTGLFNAQGSAAIAKMEVMFIIGLALGCGGAGALGVASLGLASISDVSLRFGSVYPKISKALFAFADARRELKLIAPNLTAMVDAMIESAFANQIPKTVCDTAAEAFSDPVNLAGLIGTLISGSAAEEFGVALKAVAKATAYVVKEVFVHVLKSYIPSAPNGTADKIFNASVKSVTVATQQATQTAKTISSALTTVANSGGAVYIISGLDQNLVAGAVQEIARNPEGVKRCLRDMLDAVNTFPDLGL